MQTTEPVKLEEAFIIVFGLHSNDFFFLQLDERLTKFLEPFETISKEEYFERYPILF